MALINAYLNLIKSSLVLKIKKPNLELISANNLDLAKKSDFTIFLDLENFVLKFT